MFRKVRRWPHSFTLKVSIPTTRLDSKVRGMAVRREGRGRWCAAQSGQENSVARRMREKWSFGGCPKLVCVPAGPCFLRRSFASRRRPRCAEHASASRSSGPSAPRPSPRPTPRRLRRPRRTTCCPGSHARPRIRSSSPAHHRSPRRPTWWADQSCPGGARRSSGIGIERTSRVGGR